MAEDLPTLLKQLNPDPRGPGRLQEAAARAGIPVSVTEAVPQAASRQSGIVGPLTEQVYDGSTFYQETSSDGLFVLEFTSYTDYLDGAGDTIRVVHIDPAA